MPGDAVGTAVAMLRQAYDDKLRELRRIESALQALGQPPVGPLSSLGPAARASHERPRITRRVRPEVVAIAEEYYGPWSAPEIERELAKRGYAFDVKDLKNAIRSAISEAHRAGVLVRQGYGQYVARRWLPQSDEIASDAGLVRTEPATDEKESPIGE